MSFTNPMFNVDPPSNIYTEEPSMDITFGVDNPGYVAMTDLPANETETVNVADNEAGNLYEIIDMTEAKENNNEDRISDSLSNINIEVMDVDLNYKIEQTTKTLADPANQLFEEQKEESLDNILEITTSKELGYEAQVDCEDVVEQNVENNLETTDLDEIISNDDKHLTNDENLKRLPSDNKLIK